MFYAEIVPNERLETLLSAHNKAFEYFGGYCSEGLYDNMKTVVKKIEKDKIYNERFMDFANFYGFKVLTHRPYNPRAKGKIERIVPYVRNNILYGKSYGSLEEVQSSLLAWLEEANRRLHSELKEIPFERFKTEKKFLNKIERFYPLRRTETRIVQEGNRVTYQNRAYEVPNAKGKKVNISAEGGMIKIYDQDELVAESPLKVPVEMRTLRFMYEKENVIFLGPPGVGKTHLAVGLGIEAIKEGKKAYFINAITLVDRLKKAFYERAFERQVRFYKSLDLFIIDELGYLPLDSEGAKLFFELISEKYEQGSVIITSNRSFNEWDKIFEDEVIASAILDRLLHHSTLINIRGKSYRLKEKEKSGMIKLETSKATDESAQIWPMKMRKTDRWNCAIPDRC